MIEDKEIRTLLFEEEERQQTVINLIASENYCSKEVLNALGSSLTNKYAEGYPNKRYYGGNEKIDEVELLCQKRALELFNLTDTEWRVNVQPYSGSPANLAVYSALVPIGEKIMGMMLPHGGHLTHGQKVSATGKFWQQVPYGVSDKTEMLDYDELFEIANKEKPLLIIAGFTAYPRVVSFERFKKIADSIGAYLMVDMSHFAGLVAGKQYPSPFEYADVVTTTIHKTLRGPRHAFIFSRNEAISKKIDKSVFPGLQGGPHMNTIAAAAVALNEAAQPEFEEYAKQIIQNAQTLSETLTTLGWRIVSGGTDSHLLLVDTWMGGNGITGKEASERLEKEGIIVNMNTIPFDKRSPFDPSGIRLGTAAETTRGKGKEDMIEIANKINSILKK